MKTFLLLMLLPLAAQADLPRFVRGIRVTAPPPALRYEAPPPAPSRRHQWIAGYWAWRAGKNVWVGGRWAIPPAPGYVWEPARTVNESGATMFYDGHWRAGDDPDPAQAYAPPAPPVQEVVTDEAPPPAQEEVRPPPPFAGATWIPGYWSWSGGQHAWVAGRWSAQPPGYEWHEHHWDKRDDGRWVERPGHWRHDERRDERHDEHREHDRR